MSADRGTTLGAAPGSLPSVRLSDSYGKIPISFEANQGQADERVPFLARGAGYNVYLTSSEVVLVLRRSHGTGMRSHGFQAPMLRRIGARGNENTVETAAVRMRLIGSNPAASAKGMEPLPGKANYLIGNDPRKWHVDVPTYAKVRFADIYRGIDLVYYGNREGRLEHDFVVAPGADPNQIEFDLRDGDRTSILNDGELTLRTKAGDVRLRAPVAYQVIGGERRRVQESYEADTSGHIRLRLGWYDSHYPLIIDPVLVYSAVFGGSGMDFPTAMTIDTERNVYLTGLAYSSDFPVVDPYQSTPNGIPSIFVSKLNAAGTALLYSTYFATLGNEIAGTDTIAVDGNGRIYFSGSVSGEIPIVNAYQPTYGGGIDAFVAVLNPEGNALEWSTYLGGPNMDAPGAMALDAFGNVYVTGYTAGGFPVLHSILPQSAYGSWVAKFNNSGVLQYSSIFNMHGESQAITADWNGSAYITGRGVAPTTPGAFRSTCPFDCAWVTKLSPTGDSLVYSTYLGANANDSPVGGTAIALDSDLNAYIGGITGPGLPVWSRGFQRTFGGGKIDGFVVKLNATGSNLIWSTYLGGSGDDGITGLALDQYRQVYVTGLSCSPNFPLKAPIETYAGTRAQPCQWFVTTLSGSLSSIQYYSTFLGSPAIYVAGELVRGAIAVDSALNVYVAGPDDNNVQPTPGAYSVGSSSMDRLPKLFVSKLTIMDDLALAQSASAILVPNGVNLTYRIVVTSMGPDFAVNVRMSDKIPSGATLVSYDAGGGSCTAPLIGNTGTLNCRLARLNKGSRWVVKLTVKASSNSRTPLSNTAATISNMQDFVMSNNSSTITSRVE